MTPLLAVLVALGAAAGLVAAARRRAERTEAGMTTETVIITAVLAGLALVATAIIVNKVTTKADNIDLDKAPAPRTSPTT